MGNSERKTPKIISTETLQKIIGLIGLTFPLVLAIGYFFTDNEFQILRSISAYYHSGMRDIFVGLIFAIALALFSYKGYDDGKGDNFYSNIAAGSGILVAVLPTALDCDADEASIINEFHLFFAGMFLLALAYMSLKLFTLMDKSEVTAEKIIRNKIYIFCGWIIILMLVACILYFFYEKYLNDGECVLDIKIYSPIFLFEAIAIMAFAFSWLVKGGCCFKDKKA